MTHTTLASDALILAAGALTVTAAATVTATPPFKTSLGTEGDDDSLCAPDAEEAVSTTTPTTEDSKPPVHPASEQAALKPGAVEKKVVTFVTVEEVPSTPDALDVRVQDSIFAAS